MILSKLSFETNFPKKLVLVLGLDEEAEKKIRKLKKNKKAENKIRKLKKSKKAEKK